jgi:phosphoribosylamine---glycine ligase
VRELARRGRPFRGALYAGLMITPQGIRVIEFNCRLGDPETQPILMRLQGDLVPALLAAAQGDLSQVRIAADPRPAVGVVLAAEGYPGKAAAGDAIQGADEDYGEGLQVFQAGTALAADGRLVSAGGRVLTVTALGTDLAAARERAYGALGRIRLRGSHYRKDIGTP